MTFIALAPADATALSPEQLTAAVQQITDFLLRYALALTAVGALAMVLVELVKLVTDGRSRFHARRVTAFFRSLPATPVARERALGELLDVCTGVGAEAGATEAARLMAGDGALPGRFAFGRTPVRVLFALDTDRLAATMQEAADLALQFPDRFPALYEVLTASGDRRDVTGWQHDALALAEPTATKRDAKERADRVARLRQMTKRRVDGFALYTNDRWVTVNQVAANAAGIVTMALVLTVHNANAAPTARLPFALVVGLSVLGGVLSPVAKDVVSTLRRVKSGA
jgi:hypothetical protein